MAVGRINSIETFGAVDGPGVRYIVFLQGCAMRCTYCHNPETWGPAAEGSYEATAAEVFDAAWRYRSYWKGGGGITVSGGEALLQPEFVAELFEIAHTHGVHTTLDTAAQPFTRTEPAFSRIARLIDATDLVLLDIKHIDAAAHQKLTGWSNENILDFARYLDERSVPIWLRHVLVPGITTDEDALRRLRAFLDTLSNVERVEVLPYHTLGVAKYDKLGIAYPLAGVEPPTDEQVARAEEILRAGEQGRPVPSASLAQTA